MSAVLQPLQCSGALSVRVPLFSGGVRLAGWFLFESHLDGKIDGLCSGSVLTCCGQVGLDRESLVVLG